MLQHMAPHLLRPTHSISTTPKISGSAPSYQQYIPIHHKPCRAVCVSTAAVSALTCLQWCQHSIVKQALCLHVLAALQVA